MFNNYNIYILIIILKTLIKELFFYFSKINDSICKVEVLSSFLNLIVIDLLSLFYRF